MTLSGQDRKLLHNALSCQSLARSFVSEHNTLGQSTKSRSEKRDTFTGRAKNGHV